jgi:hypothetical protein
MLWSHRRSAVCGSGDERIRPSATVLRSDGSIRGIVYVPPLEGTFVSKLSSGQSTSLLRRWSEEAQVLRHGTVSLFAPDPPSVSKSA